VISLKLAEALEQLKAIKTKAEETRKIANSGVKIQEGDTLGLTCADAIDEFNTLTKSYEDLLKKINRANQTVVDKKTGVTLSDLLVERDTQSYRVRMLDDIIRDATTSEFRLGRNEIRTILTIDVNKYRALRDEISENYRILNSRIQQMNWTIEISVDV